VDGTTFVPSPRAAHAESVAEWFAKAKAGPFLISTLSESKKAWQNNVRRILPHISTFGVTRRISLRLVTVSAGANGTPVRSRRSSSRRSARWRASAAILSFYLAAASSLARSATRSSVFIGRLGGNVPS
jgi:hypothetical protein